MSESEPGWFLLNPHLARCDVAFAPGLANIHFPNMFFVTFLESVDDADDVTLVGSEHGSSLDLLRVLAEKKLQG